ncbi:MAG: hypothetical protein MUF84_07045 [Anaerolineae bacterium]|nr:hypothetical protein [Anaerolineae bacterium]
MDAVLSWLLQEDNPPVRLLTLTRLLQRPETDPEAQDARSRLMTYSVTQEILSHSDEIWASGPRMAWSFRGKLWNTVYLGYFMADGHDPRIAPGVGALLSQRWVHDDFGCYVASGLTAFRRLGYGSHPAVIEGTEALAQRVLDDGGLTCMGMNNSLMPGCYMALPKLLLCFGEVPPEERSPAVQHAIDWIVKELVDHQVYLYLPTNEKAWDEVRPRSRRKADAPPGETPESWRDKEKARFIAEHGLGKLQPKEIWTRFGFPLNYNSDILEAMVALATVGAPMSEKLEKPLQVIRDKRTKDGTWLMEKSLNRQMWADVETKGKPSKWITYRALLVLSHFAGEDQNLWGH